MRIDRRLLGFAAVVLGLALFAMPAFADTFVYSQETAAGYEIKGLPTAVVSSPGTTVSVPFKIISKQDAPLTIHLSAACMDASGTDRSCEWASFDGEQRRMITVDGHGTSDIDLKITVPQDAQRMTYRMGVAVQVPPKIKIIPLELKLDGGTSGGALEWTANAFPFLTWELQLPKPCLKYFDVAANASNATGGEPACEKHLSVPVWFVVLILIGAGAVLWRVR